MKDNDDSHDILFARLFKFKLKGRFKNNKNRPNSPYYEKDYKKYQDDGKENSICAQDRYM